MPEMRRQLLRFAGVGAAGFALDVLVLYLALALGAGHYGGRALSFLAAVYATWRLNRRYTFAAAGGSRWREWWRYLLAMLAGGLVNYGVYSALVALLAPRPWLPLAAVAVGSLAGMGVNFAGARMLVFRA